MSSLKPPSGILAAYFAFGFDKSDAAALARLITEHRGHAEAKRVLADAVPKRKTGRPMGRSRFEDINAWMVELFDLFRDATPPGLSDNWVAEAVAWRAWRLYGTAAGSSELGVRKRLADLLLKRQRR